MLLLRIHHDDSSRIVEVGRALDDQLPHFVGDVASRDDLDRRRGSRALAHHQNLLS